MIYLRLFLNFLMIGALSFGGGYGMVSLVRETVLSNGWLTENEFLNFIAVSESTPEPLAVNMATFIGSTLGGILGSFVATLGVVLPSFLIILLIASALKNLMKYAPVNAFLSGVRPCVVAMILATALSMALSSNRHIVTQQLNSQAVHGHKLCAVCLGRSNRNFRSSKCVKHIVCFTWPF